MLSPARLAANRRNALKSTGPRTAEGKARSRRNAVKHGLRSEQEVLPPEDESLFRERLQSWVDDLQPRDQAEEYLIRAAVLATVKLDRCTRADFAYSAQMRREVLVDWKTRQDVEVSEASARLADDPAGALAQLQEFAAGCGWLIEQWKTLREPLESPGYWNHDQAAHAVRLLGHRPDCADCLDPCVLSLSLCFLACLPEVDPDEVDRLFGVSTATLEPSERQRTLEARLPEASTARDALQGIVAGEIERLGKLRRQLWTEQDGPDLAEEINVAVVDTSPEGALLHRYAAASHQQLFRCLHELGARQKSVSGLGAGSLGRERLVRVPSQSFSPEPPIAEPVENLAASVAPVPPNEPTESPPEARTLPAAEASTITSSAPEPASQAELPNEPRPAGVGGPTSAAAAPVTYPTGPSRPMSERELFDLQRRLGGYLSP